MAFHRSIELAKNLAICFVFMQGTALLGQTPWSTGTDIIYTTTDDVGIGTDDPLTTFHIKNTTTFDLLWTEAGQDNIYLASTGSEGVGAVGASIGFSRVNGAGRRAAIALVQTDTDADRSGLAFYTHPSAGGANPLVEAMRIDHIGNVGIGTASPQSLLAVNGTITAKEVEVTSSGWPDYVFASDYNLMPLNELATYIASNGHLPEVPSSEEVAANGLNLGESQALLLKKIEELTLHMIAMQKENEALKEQVYELEEK